MTTSNKFVTTLKVTLIAGSIDILLAFIDVWFSAGVSPASVLRYIASGLLGDAAFEGPVSVALLGLLIHYLIAFFWTAFFFLLYPEIRSLIPGKFLQAVLYGIVIWLAMNLFVVPASAAPADRDFHWLEVIKGMVILILAIGWPLSYFAYKYHARRGIRR